MLKRILVLQVIPLLLICLNLANAVEGDGGYAGAFLEIKSVARSLGMGNAFVGVAEDATASFSNPAGLFQLKKRSFSFSYRFMTQDRKLGYVAYAQPVRNEAALGLSWIYAGVSDVMERNDRGEIIGDIGNSNNAVTFSFSRKIKEKLLFLGMNLRYIQTNIAGVGTYSIGFDFGALVTPVKNLRIGFVSENIGSKFNWSSGEFWSKYGELGTATKEDFPVNFKLGAAYLELKEKLLLAAEIEKSTKQNLRVHLGTEFWALKELAIRAGYDDGSFTVGAGVRQNLKKIIFGFDYALATSKADDLSPDHLLSLQIEF